jgi:hypothetical protein
MPTMWEREPDDVITTYLGQFDRVTANAIAARLEAAGIVWWYKEPGVVSVVWEFGVRLFVDREHLGRARAIVEEVRASALDEPPGGEVPPGPDVPADGP